MNANLGKTIRILRQAKSLKASELAQASGISVPFLSLLESGARQPSLEVLRRIASALRIPSEAMVVLAMGPRSGLTLADPTAREISSAVDNLIHVEDRLKQLLESGGSAVETEGH